MPQLNVQPAVGRPACSGRHGAVLLLAAVVLVAVSVLGLSLLSLAEANGTQLARDRQSASAFWVAEGGLHHALAQLSCLSAYRALPAPFTNTLGEGHCGVSVARTGTVYTITSTGRAAQAVRTVCLRVDVQDDGWPTAFADYALFSGAGSIALKQNVTINGNVYADGTASINGGVVNGVVQATSVSGGASMTAAPIPDPPIETPALDTSFYDVLLSAAAAWPGPALSYPLNLAGTTQYVKGGANIGDINGPGVLVVSGSVSLSKDVTIGGNVTLVCGALTVAKDFQTGTNCLIFSRGDVNIDKNGLNLIGCALITPASIAVKKDLTFSGIMFAGGTITFDKAANLTGSIVADGNISADKNLTFTQMPGVFPPTLPPGFSGEVSMQKLFWEDLGSAQR